MLRSVFSKLYTSYRRKKQRLDWIKLTTPAYIHFSATFNFQQNISIGKYCRIGHECHIDGEGFVEIGDGTILAPRVVILSSSHHYKKSDLLPYGFEDIKSPVIIGKGCWIGWGAMIRPGVRIGDGAVIAMGSVVVKDVGDGEVAGGNPAQIIATRENKIELLKMIEQEKYFVKECIEKTVARKGRRLNIKYNLIE
jgi:maltose O-acetyltransferase